jgi:hypothetical protein
MSAPEKIWKLLLRWMGLLKKEKAAHGAGTAFRFDKNEINARPGGEGAWTFSASTTIHCSCV